MNNLTVSRQEREEIAKNCILKKEGLTQQIIDLNLAIKIMRKYRHEAGLSNVVEIRAIESLKRRHTNRNFSFVKDRDFDVSYGVYNEIRKDGSIMWRMLSLDELIVLDLTRPDDAKRWMVYRMHHRLQGSPLLGYNEALYEIYDPVVNTKLELDSAEQFVKAFSIIEKMDAEKMVLLARYVGLNAELQDESRVNMVTLKGMLVRKAKENPIAFNNKLNDNERRYHSFLSSAVNYGIVHKHEHKGLTYNDIFLGMSDNDAVLKLKQQHEIFQGIINEVFSRDTLIIKLGKEQEKTTIDETL